MNAVTTHRVRRISGVVSTDDIIPARYKHMHTDPRLLAPHLFEAYRPGFVDTLLPGDAIVSDSIFGIGSSREQAVSTLLANQVSLVIAPRFGRILFRNCWNLALPAIEADTDRLAEGSMIVLDLGRGEIRCGEQSLARFAPPPAFLLDMIGSGGLLARVRADLRQGG
ncbi:3-isopropylmalate dehydratase [Nonomuraea fuscirosea]|uniref:LeuD/DmdB family oxidoreductase small subunit n=1 Tax=Nonomuraea fuscirosea TaxID=1291556 RepID=UPI00342DB7A9